MLRPEPTLGLPDSLIQPLIDAALQEDLGRRGDVTTLATVAVDQQATLHMVARQTGVVAGLNLARLAFQTVSAQIVFRAEVAEGAAIAAGQVLATVTGPAQALLTAERTALNFMTHLSGIASQTAVIVAAIQPFGTVLTCTRKTIPGLRLLQKYAVRVGGGRNHRMGLDDAILIKDNHIALAGGIVPALTAAKAYAGHLIPVEIEVDTLAQLEQALATGVDLVLLDNMSLTDLKTAVQLCKGQAKTEASGGITPQQAVAVAQTGVDFMAMGWLTHSSQALDIGFDVLAHEREGA
ncbi:MAG: carboxylating nicotinate-nucleotide diphosphorylase [Neisseriaceae bacterium]|nr:carboxylating nicotinate-nucleotide diphosphorylase [Neisseriaceae bacterium]MBP6861284.1 carboxylating nicotinate-nucleotide diphosphorylase [Neisseriaceae bacterium]